MLSLLKCFNQVLLKVNNNENFHIQIKTLLPNAVSAVKEE
jgi:hypothetical protein